MLALISSLYHTFEWRYSSRCSFKAQTCHVSASYRISVLVSKVLQILFLSNDMFHDARRLLNFSVDVWAAELVGLMNWIPLSTLRNFWLNFNAKYLQLGTRFCQEFKIFGKDANVKHKNILGGSASFCKFSIVSHEVLRSRYIQQCFCIPIFWLLATEMFDSWLYLGN